MRLLWAPPLRCLLRPSVTVRYRSGGTRNRRAKRSREQDEKQYNDAYVKIINQSNKRMQEALAREVPIGVFPDLESVSVTHNGTVRAGDLVWTGNSVEFVLRMPQIFVDNLLTLNMRGIITETPLDRIEARLGSASSFPNMFEIIRLADIAVDETTRAEIEHAHHDLQKTYSQLQIIGKPVASWLYRLVAPKLRKYQNALEFKARELKPQVCAAVQGIQDPTNVVVMPMTDFVRRIASPSALHHIAVQLCLEDESLQFSVQKSVSYMSTDYLLIRPRQMSEEMSEAQVSATVSEQFLKDYAIGNFIGNGLSESRAIQELRQKFPNAEYIDSQEACELLKLKERGMWDRLGYRWIKQIAESNRLEPQSATEDMLAEIREDFDAPVYCLDSSKSKLVEDGISVEEVSAESLRIGIHISNPSAFMDLAAVFGPNLPLSSTVLEQGGICRMLPKTFSEKLSLNAKGRPSLSVFASYNLRTGELGSVEAKALRLQKIYNVDPKEIDVNRQPFDLMWRITQRSIRKRFENGAFLLNPYTQETAANQDLPLLLPRANSSHSIVEEFMLLGSEMAAIYCEKHKISIFYRTRELLLSTPELSREFNAERVANNGFVGVHWRKYISGTGISLKPSSFPGIGTSFHTRFTSPLRRLEDLLTHVQMQAYLLARNSKRKLSKVNRFKKRKLARIQDRLQVMEYFIQMLNREVSYSETFSRAALEAGMKVLGVVVRNVADSSRSSIYLPELGLYADYTGDELLPIEHKQEFTVARVLSHARVLQVI